ncbi:hypothetical protein JCM10207_003084 [Rhodosporidiobolus poonsookiae]
MSDTHRQIAPFQPHDNRSRQRSPTRLERLQAPFKQLQKDVANERDWERLKSKSRGKEYRPGPRTHFRILTQAVLKPSNAR